MQKFSDYVGLRENDTTWQQHGASNYEPHAAANVKGYYGDNKKLQETVTAVDRAISDVLRRLGELKVVHPGLGSEKAALALKDAWNQDIRHFYSAFGDDE